MLRAVAKLISKFGEGREREAARRREHQGHDAMAARRSDPSVTSDEYTALMVAQAQALRSGEGGLGTVEIGDGRKALARCVSLSPERWYAEIFTPGIHRYDANGERMGWLKEPVTHKVFYRMPSPVTEWPVEVVPLKRVNTGEPYGQGIPATPRHLLG